MFDLSRTRRESRWAGWRLGATVLLVSISPACDDDADSSVGDAALDATDAGGDALADQGQALILPDPPVLTPCPEGWREVDPEGADGPARCDPWPTDGHLACSGAAAHFPGEPGCTPLGETCPEADWSDQIPDDVPVLYVRSGAASGGSGTVEAPFATIGEATAAVTQDTVIALSTGRFDELVGLPAGVTLWGACVAETVLGSSQPHLLGDPDDTLLASVRALGPGVSVRNLTVAGARSALLAVDEAELAITDVLVELSDGYALGGHANASLTVSHSAVRGVPEGPTAGLRAVTAIPPLPNDEGQVLPADPVISLSQVEISGVAVGVLVFGGSLSVADVVVDQPSPAPGLTGEPYALGVFVAGGGAATITRSTFACLPHTSIQANGESSRIHAADVVIAAFPDDPSCLGGAGIVAVGGGHIEAQRVLVMEPVGSGLAAVSGGFVAATDLVIEGTRGTPVAAAVLASTISDPAAGPDITLSRVRLVGNHGTGILAAEEVRLVGTDVAILGTEELICAPDCPDALLGIGLAVQGTAQVQLTRFELADSALCGLQLSAGELDLSEGSVHRNVIGVNLQVPDYDLARLTSGVVFQENDRDLDSEALPVPDPASLLQSLF